MGFYVGNRRVTSDDFFKELRNELNKLYDYDAIMIYDETTNRYEFAIFGKDNMPVYKLGHCDGIDDIFRTSDVINRIEKIRQITNFDKITKDMDTLARFITNVTDACYDPVSECDRCPLRECGCTYKDLMTWFKEEAPKDDES